MKRSIFLPLLLATALTGCGPFGSGSTAASFAAAESYSGYGNNYAASTDTMMEMSAESAMPDGNRMSANSAADSSGDRISEERKLIRTVSISLTIPSSERLQESTETIRTAVEGCGGYISSNYSEYGDYASASLSARIPKDRADEFIEKVKGSGMRLRNLNDSSSDVTLQYVDVESRLRVKQETREKYEEYLKASENIQDTMAIEEQLAAVTEEIESYQSQMNTLNNQIDYTSIDIHIGCEVTAEKTGFGEKLVDAVRNLAEEAGDTFISMLSWFVKALISLIFILPVMYLVVRVFLLAIGKKPKFFLHKKNKTD